MPQTAFIEHCLELLAPLASLGEVRAKRMFGGVGVYVGELFIAIVTGERLYLKADAQTLPHFETAGCSPFTYLAQGQVRVMSYFSAPEEALESQTCMQPWARLALDAALRAKLAKRPAAARKPAAAAPASAAMPAKPTARRRSAKS